MKIVVNRCWGGFSVSEDVYKALGLVWNGFGYPENEDFGLFEDENKLAYRKHALLISAIETLGAAANGHDSKLEVVEIPDDVDWMINNYDGNETIVEKHRSW